MSPEKEFNVYQGKVVPTPREIINLALAEIDEEGNVTYHDSGSGSPFPRRADSPINMEKMSPDEYQQHIRSAARVLAEDLYYIYNQLEEDALAGLGAFLARYRHDTNFLEKVAELVFLDKDGHIQKP